MNLVILVYSGSIQHYYTAIIGNYYFGMYLWAMGSGRPRTIDELTGMLFAAGFRKCKELPTSMPILVRVISAIA